MCFCCFIKYSSNPSCDMVKGRGRNSGPAGMSRPQIHLSQPPSPCGISNSASIMSSSTICIYICIWGLSLRCTRFESSLLESGLSGLGICTTAHLRPDSTVSLYRRRTSTAIQTCYLGYVSAKQCRSRICSPLNSTSSASSSTP